MKAINVLRMRKSALGSLSTNQTSGTSTDSTFFWVAGFVAAASLEFSESGTVGSMVSTALGPATVVGCFWKSFTGFGGNGSVVVEVTGDRSAGSVSKLTIAGSDQGTVSAPSYNAGSNTTTFQFGSVKPNPFTGTQAITIR